MIADNRHYPFYVWRKILNRHPLARYAVIPVYPAAAALLYTAIGELLPGQAGQRLMPELQHALEYGACYLY
jgi:hypothetical protein